LLGGPQAGIVAGKREYVSAMRKDPMYRALRADKLIIALIEIVLTQYLSPDPTESLPVINLASQSPDAIQKRLQIFLSNIETEAKAVGFNLSIVASHSTLGGGSLPGKTLPSFALQIESQSQSSAKISASLRGFETPVITTIQDERVQIDFRTILPRDEADLLRAVRSLWSPS
jgi:L-seryl-tRNA(Ser) seleniumtransferase